MKTFLLALLLVVACHTAPASAAADPTGPAVSQSCKWYDVPCVVSAFSTWLADVVLYVPRKVWQWMMDALAGIIEAIPVPGFVSQARAAMGNIPASVGWLLGLFQFPFGVTVVSGAYILRFLLRRIPFIG